MLCWTHILLPPSLAKSEKNVDKHPKHETLCARMFSTLSLFLLFFPSLPLHPSGRSFLISSKLVYGQAIFSPGAAEDKGHLSFLAFKGTQCPFLECQESPFRRSLVTAFQEKIKKNACELKLILGNFKPTGTSLRKPEHKQGVRKQTLL